MKSCTRVTQYKELEYDSTGQLLHRDIERQRRKESVWKRKNEGLYQELKYDNVGQLTHRKVERQMKGLSGKFCPSIKWKRKNERPHQSLPVT